MNYILFIETGIIIALIVTFIVALIVFLYFKPTKQKVIPQTKTNKSYFGYNIKFLRIKNLISLNVLQKETNISIQRLAEIENTNSNPSLKEIECLSNYFHLSTTEIVYIDLVDNYVKNYIPTESSNDTKDLF